MWLLLKTAWRNLFRQRRRTAITVSAMAFSLLLAIPTWGLMEGLSGQMLKGITRMDLGHIQLHDPAYPQSKALQSTLRRPAQILKKLRDTKGVVAATPRVHGYALAAKDMKLEVTIAGMNAPVGQKDVLFGRSIAAKAPWRTDRALACEALVERKIALKHAIVVGTVLTPKKALGGGWCERVKIVGLTTGSLPGVKGGKGLVVGLPVADVQKAFKKKTVRTSVVVRRSAALEIRGVDPGHEQKVTFMAEKVIKGRYLKGDAKAEIVVGYRLARTMRLKIGDKLFVQAATLDQSKGSFYQDFKVVGIYRTGVDMLDRVRVFIHYKDAQRVMSLEKRVHEIALVGKNAKESGKLLTLLKKKLASNLQISTKSTGKRAGSAPLPAPVVVFEPKGKDVVTIIPYDLKRRFDELETVKAVARRVYAETEASTSKSIELSLKTLSAQALQALVGSEVKDACMVFPSQNQAKKLLLKKGMKLLLKDKVMGNEASCKQVLIGAPYTPKDGTDVALALKPVENDDMDETPGLEEGSLSLVQIGKASKIRLVGVEASYERSLSKLDKALASGSYFTKSQQSDEDDTRWPALLSQREARRLGAKVGQTLLLKRRDNAGNYHWRAVVVKGLVKDSTWSKDFPQVILSYYSAQQIDSKQLNARAHEMLLLPVKGATPDKIVQDAKAQLLPLARTWQQIAPDMAKLIQTQDVWTGILLFIIFGLAAMTVMNTMLMAVFERTREFGVLKSIGMTPRQVFSLIVFETLALAFLAAVLGGIGGMLLNHWAVVDGIDLSRWTGGFTYQGTFINPVWRATHSLKVYVIPLIMVQVVCLMVSIYPALRAGFLKPVKALRHHG